MSAQVSSKWLKLATFYITFLLFLGNFVIQSWALGRQVRPSTDEGVNLYEAKLITQGYLPYKDFAMTSHVPFLMYLNAFVLKICNFDMFTYHIIYVIWVFLTIFPLFYTVLYFTRSRIASIFSIVLFSTFTELVQWDAHFFAIRQASLPFFACFIYFFFVKKKERLSQIFLSLFSFCLIPNFFISLVFVIVLVLYDYAKHKISLWEWIKNQVCTYWIFVLLTCTYFSLVLLIPGSLSNLLAEQKDIYPYLQRLIIVGDMMRFNSPIFLFGGLGIALLRKEFPLLSMLSVLTLLITLFASGSFYYHHVVIIAVPFAIMGGLFINKILLILNLDKIKIALVSKIALVCIIFFYLYISSYVYLSKVLILKTTPNFFRSIRVLEQSPEPLFTLQPIYALYAHRNLVMYYNTADIRVLSPPKTNLSYEEYQDILNRSNTVLLEPFTNRKLPKKIKAEIRRKYSLVYSDRTERIYVKRALKARIN